MKLLILIYGCIVMVFMNPKECRAESVPEMDYNLNGFVYGTYFSDKDWYPSAYGVAVGLDVYKDEFVFRSQVGAPFNHPVRRLSLEWGSVFDGKEVVLKIGRFSRIASFYNIVSESPGTTNLAILPPGQFNRRMVQNATFNSIDGVSVLVSSTPAPDTYAKLRLHYGKTVVDNQCAFQYEVTRTGCYQGFDYQGLYGTYDVYLELEHKKWKAFLYRGSSRATTILKDPNDPPSAFEYNFSRRLVYDVNKIGLQYNDNTWLFQGEYTATAFTAGSREKTLSYFQKAFSHYVLVGYTWNGNITHYVNHSAGHDADNGQMRDLGIGTTVVTGDVTTSLEHHRGRGRTWKKYFAETPNWNSWVLSVSYRF